MPEKRIKPYVVGIAGGTASGKTTLARIIAQHSSDKQVAVIPLDNYYRSNGHITLEERARLNYDHPDQIESTLLARHIQALKSGQPVDMPSYDFRIHTRSGETCPISPVPLIAVEGILTLHYPELLSLFDFTIFVDASPSLRLERRMRRDIAERGRTKESVLSQWNETVHPMHEQYCEPSRAHAQVIVDGSCFDLQSCLPLVSEIFRQAGIGS